jgi:hypothetical protein
MSEKEMGEFMAEVGCVLCVLCVCQCVVVCQCLCVVYKSTVCDVCSHRDCVVRVDDVVATAQGVHARQRCGMRDRVCVCRMSCSCSACALTPNRCSACVRVCGVCILRCMCVAVSVCA